MSVSNKRRDRSMLIEWNDAHGAGDDFLREAGVEDLHGVAGKVSGLVIMHKTSRLLACYPRGKLCKL